MVHECCLRLAPFHGAEAGQGSACRESTMNDGNRDCNPCLGSLMWEVDRVDEQHEKIGVWTGLSQVEFSRISTTRRSFDTVIDNKNGVDTTVAGASVTAAH